MTDLGRFQPAATWVGETARSLRGAAAGSSLLRWAGPLVSLLIVIVAANAFRTVDLAQVRALIPASPLFWGVFALFYLAQPGVDFVIFRRLWRLPLGGFAALTRKFISNEILFGYSGELYFYAWMRRWLGPGLGEVAPFGAIKDVAVLSALTGNLVTLGMFVVARPMIAALDLGAHGQTAFTSIAVLVVSSLAIMVFRGRVFSLTREQLAGVALLQFGRIVLTTTLAAVLWSLVLPQVAFGMWLALASVRLLISRLPLVPNKDLVFAGVAATIVGTTSGIAPLLAMMAGLTIVTHLVVGAVLAAADVAGLDRAK